MSFRIQEINTDNISMRCAVFGSGKKALVIIPGVSVKSVLESAKQIETAYSVFLEEYTLYLFDRRLNMPEEYPVTQMAADTAKAMTALGLNNCCLFGASQGGMIALLIAAKHPELVCSLALASTAIEITDKAQVCIKQWAALAREGKAEELFLRFGEAVYPKNAFVLLKEYLICTSQQATAQELQRFATVCEGMKDYNAEKELESLRCPLFVAGAEDDAVLGVESSLKIIEKMKGKPHFHYHIYSPGFGHAVYDTAPDFKKRLYRFFNEG